MSTRNSKGSMLSYMRWSARGILLVAIACSGMVTVSGITGKLFGYIRDRTYAAVLIEGGRAFLVVLYFAAAVMCIIFVSVAVLTLKDKRVTGKSGARRR